MRPRLVDWSRYQGKTDLRLTVDTWDLAGIMLRCTIGWAYFDSYYEDNFRQALEIKQDCPEFIIGAYHVLWPWNRDPLKEVKWFKDHMKIDGIAPDFLIDDLELPNTAKGWQTITPREVGNQIVVQLPAIENETGLRVLAYSGSWWWNDKKYMGTVTPLGIENEYALIEAEYTDRIVQVGGRDFSEAPEPPKVPQELGKGWTLADCAMWQWTSKLKGIGTTSKSQDGDVLMWPWEDFIDFIRLKPPELTDHEKITILWEKHPELHPPTEG